MHRLLTLHNLPAVRPTLQIDVARDRIERRKLERQLATPVQPKARTVENLVVLPSNHIEIDQRQVCLHHAGDHVAQPRVMLAAIVGRAVGHQQELGTRLGKRFGHVLVPGIFADGGTDPHIAYGIGAAQRPAVEYPNLVKYGFIWQMVLEHT